MEAASRGISRVARGQPEGGNEVLGALRRGGDMFRKLHANNRAEEAAYSVPGGLLG